MCVEKSYHSLTPTDMDHEQLHFFVIVSLSFGSSLARAASNASMSTRLLHSRS